MYDVIIIGGGPAGLSAAIYTSRALKKTLIIEESNFGGQITQALEVENYPGYEKISGMELGEKMYHQAIHLGAESVYGTVKKIVKENDTFVITVGEKEYTAKVLIYGAGASPRKLCIEEEKKYLGSGLSYCATCDGAFFKGKTVCVIGGGNTAIDDAIYLANICKKVYVIHRRDTFRAEPIKVNTLKERKNVEFITNAKVLEIKGENKVETLVITKEQEEKILTQRKEIEKQFENSELTGKYLTRKIDDNTFINFADFILNNLENAEYNIPKIRTSLSILKDGQAVFTNLEKLYIYRYVFARGVEDENPIKLEKEKIEEIPEKDIKKMVKQMLKDKEETSPYKNNTFFENKLLWIAREYQKQGIKYIEITDTNLTKKGKAGIRVIEQMHEVMPKIEKETGVKIRLLIGIRRIPLTIIKDQKTSSNYLRENIDVLKAIAKSPYVAGSDFIGEEINDISELQPAITEIVRYVVEQDPNFTIRIHAGENDSLRENVEKSIDCIINSLKPGEKIPNFRLGHGLYTQDLNSEKGKELIKKMQKTGAVLEFQLTSNVRLNNLSNLKKHPIKTYLKNNIKCVQGTDGCGMYGTDTIDEQLALQNLLNLNDKDFEAMRKVEEEIIERNEKNFIEKSKKFEEFLNGRTIEEAIMQEELKNEEESKNKKMNLRLRIGISSEEALKEKISELPTDKMPIIIAGGSFNAQGRETILTEEGKNILTELIKKVNNKKAYFVIGHKMQGYEKAILDISKKLNKKFEIDAIIPKTITEEVKENLEKENLKAIRISTENEDSGIYKSFNYEIFERRSSVVVAFDGNSPVSNLVQEAKNGKGKSKIYVNEENASLREKAKSLGGYVIPFTMKENIVNKIIEDNPEIAEGI